jgi:transketolase
MSVGLALGERHLNATFGDELVDHYTYVIAGDGCLMEGVSHEAISMAGHLKLAKLIVLFDDNSISIDGATDLSVSDDQLARFSASGWDVARVDGHDQEAIAAAIGAAQKTATPSLIACKTVIGFGAPKKQGTASTHGSPLGADEIAGARQALGWPHEAFVVPEHILSVWRTAGTRSTNQRKAWEARLTASTKRAEFERRMAGALPAEMTAAFDAFKKKISEEGPKWATRQSSGETLEAIFEVVPELLGGSADLTGSVNTKTKAVSILNSTNYAGRYIHYGVREFGMAAAMNGLALHKGVIPYGGTFLVFADYLRPALRLSALMGQRVIYILTHDSIGLGEDGPTHQPVETLASLRTIPNVLVIRPADAVETAEAWAAALAHTSGPTVLALSRQGLPAVRTSYTADNLVSRGAYILAEAEGKRQATIMATGSEVSIAIDARKKLQADGIGTSVVSMPSWELFAQQERSYRDQVLDPSSVRVAVEAAVHFGWGRWIGPEGAFIGMNGFGASAPAPDLYKHFGITAEAVVEAVKARL